MLMMKERKKTEIVIKLTERAENFYLKSISAITFKDYDEIAYYAEKFAEYQNENYSSAFDRRKIHVECGEFFSYRRIH